jgi:tetratricopeptide (TPR) repeat protein
MGSNKNIKSISADKFNRHMRAAEDYLRAFRYYKAADSFALALIYVPNDPQALMGRSKALFAAGEYVSSALFLCRALTNRPDYAKSKIDLVTLLGDRSRLAGRIADLEQWSARSGSPQLRLLIGHVYLQTGRLNEASKAIEAAGAKMPQSGAVGAMKAAVAAAAR